MSSFDPLQPPPSSAQTITTTTLPSTSRSQSTRKTNVLHRNKACLSCRARKTKCDAVKPICSSCKRLPPDQQSQCRYDQPPKWLESVVSSNNRSDHKRIIELETKLESLQRTLLQLQTTLAIRRDQERQVHLQAQLPLQALQPNTPHPSSIYPPLPSHPSLVSPSSTKYPLLNHLPTQDLILSNQDEFDFDPSHSLQPIYTQHPNRHPNHPPLAIIDDRALNHPLVIRQHDGHLTQTELNPYQFVAPILSSPSPSVSSSIQDISPSSPHHLNHLQHNSDLLLLSEPNWLPHLPPRRICKLLIKAFFNRPLSPFKLVDPIGLQSRLELNCSDPHFPEPALIHAICATGAQHISPQVLQPIYWSHLQGPAFYHAQWAERLLNDSISYQRDPRRLVELAEAAVLCCQYYTIVGKPLMIWKSLGFCIRLATLVGLNVDQEPSEEHNSPYHTKTQKYQHSDHHSLLARVSFWPDGVGKLERPSDERLRHYRTVLWWYVFCCEKMCGAAGGFAPTADERDSLIPIYSPPKTAIGSTGNVTFDDPDHYFLHSSAFFFKHRTCEMGSFQLLLKAAIMLGKVNTSLYRRVHPVKSEEEFNQEHVYLSNLVRGFYHSIPEPLKNPFKPTKSGELDSCLLSAHALIHTSLIQLNEDLVGLDDDDYDQGQEAEKEGEDRFDHYRRPRRRPSVEDEHLRICKESGNLLISWFIQLIRHQSQTLISVDLGHLLCGNPALNFCLSVALRTHCRLIAINKLITQDPKEFEILNSQINQILTHLSKSAKMPLEGRVIGMITSLLDNPSELLPPRSKRNTRATHPDNLNPHSNHQVDSNDDRLTHPKFQGEIRQHFKRSSVYSMKQNFALARILDPCHT